MAKVVSQLAKPSTHTSIAGPLALLRTMRTTTAMRIPLRRGLPTPPSREAALHDDPEFGAADATPAYLKTHWGRRKDCQGLDDPLLLSYFLSHRLHILTRQAGGPSRPRGATP
jgi:hypothetical protein